MTDFQTTWSRVQQRLDSGIPNWRARIESWGQVAAVEARERGDHFTDEAVFRGIVFSVLSNNTNWERVERVRNELDELFDGYSARSYASRRPEDIDRQLIPWFEHRIHDSARTPQGPDRGGEQAP